MTGVGFMSKSVLYGAPKSGEIEVVKEYGNGWLSAPIVWNHLGRLYNIDNWMSSKANALRLFAIAKDPKIPEYQRLTMIATFDWMIIRKEAFGIFIPALKKFCSEDVGDSHCHFNDIADQMSDESLWSDYVGCCMEMTTVVSMWSEYNMATKKHWFYDHSKLSEAGGDPYE
jgi:hypothetical protein